MISNESIESRNGRLVLARLLDNASRRMYFINGPVVCVKKNQKQHPVAAFFNARAARE